MGWTLASKVGRHPKLHVVDTGLGSWWLGLAHAKLSAREPAAITEFGHILETFVVNEVLKQISWSESQVSVGHFRRGSAGEVDLVVERHDGGVVGIEVKAAGRVAGGDASGLVHLRTLLGDRFMGGVILYTGAHRHTLGDRVHVLPVDVLWS